MIGFTPNLVLEVDASPIITSSDRDQLPVAPNPILAMFVGALPAGSSLDVCQPLPSAAPENFGFAADASSCSGCDSVSQDRAAGACYSYETNSCDRRVSDCEFTQAFWEVAAF